MRVADPWGLDRPALSLGGSKKAFDAETFAIISALRIFDQR